VDLVIDQGPVFVHLDPSYTITGINKAGCSLLGCAPADIIGRDWFETFLPQESPGQALNTTGLPGELGQYHLYEHTVQTATGSLRHIRWHTSYIQDLHGQVSGSIAMGTIINPTASNAFVSDDSPNSRKAVLSAALEAQEKERQLLAAELHENVTQILTTCKLILEHNEGCNENPATQQAIGYIQKVINRVRGISHWLNPKQLSEIGLEAAIREMIGELAPSGKTHIMLHTPTPQLLAHLQAPVQLSLFRMIQEQCSNIVRYAQATKAEIYLHLNFDSVTLTITDNGVGFNLNETPFGLGLRNIKSRAENHEGSMHLETAPGKGCKLYVHLPLT
jgi:PAS domain S-box-containing protein